MYMIRPKNVFMGKNACRMSRQEYQSYFFFKSIAFVRYAVLTCKMILLVDEHCAVCCFCFVVLCNTSQRCSIEKKHTTYSYVESHIIGQLLEEIFTMLAL